MAKLLMDLKTMLTYFPRLSRGYQLWLAASCLLMLMAAAALVRNLVAGSIGAHLLPLTAYSLGVFFFTWGECYYSFSRGTRGAVPVLHATFGAVPLLLALAVLLFALCLWREPDLGDRRVVAWAALILLVTAVYEWWRASGYLMALSRRQAEATLSARAEAGEARLAALQAQMNPHFLFNALNTIAGQLARDPNEAEHTLESLAEVLRHTLYHNREVLTPLRRELDHVRAYLGVERARLKERLRVEWLLDEDLAERVLVPTMSLQPLVENAIKHGIGSRLEGGTIWIEVRRAPGVLTMAVADDGFGFVPNHQEGVGLTNLRQRLRVLHGEEAGLTIEDRDPGARVVISLPRGEEV